MFSKNRISVVFFATSVFFFVKKPLSAILQFYVGCSDVCSSVHADASVLGVTCDLQTFFYDSFLFLKSIYLFILI